MLKAIFHLSLFLAPAISGCFRISEARRRNFPTVERNPNEDFVDIQV